MSISVSLRDLAALVLAAGAAVASMVVWVDGNVDLGMELAEMDGTVRVADVTPGGNAARAGWHPGIQILDITTRDGSAVHRGEPLDLDPQIWIDYEMGLEPFPSVFGTVGGPLPDLRPDLRPPVEAVDSARIGTAVAGEFYAEDDVLTVYAAIDRTLLELELRSTIWLAAFGVALGIGVWRLLLHGLAGDVGRRHAVLLGAATTAPFLVVPVVTVGTAVGVAAGYLVPAALALLVGVSLARLHPDRSWAQTGSVAALVATGLAGVLVIRHMTSPVLSADDGGIALVTAMIALAPAIVVATASGSTFRQRFSVISLALVPAAASTVIGPRPEPFWPAVFIGLLLGWHAVPLERAVPAIGARLAATPTTEPMPTSPAVAGITAQTRDTLAVVLLGSVVLLSLVGGFSTWASIIAAALAGLVWIAVRRGFLGASWIDAGAPLAAAVGIPIAINGFDWYTSEHAWFAAPAALAALAVAHVLAGRHADAQLGSTLLWVSAAIAALVLLALVTEGGELAALLVGVIALVPAIPLALSAAPDDARVVSNRLEVMAVALTPAVAVSTVVPMGIVILLAWVVALIVWRYLTLTPLLRFAQRTQLQRDVAVAAAETERARLAADLHDDALQQLTMLVRTLDEGGHAREADEAREIATKLRSVVGDLRLPILDDLGAGAALEWLVERVEPLAGGQVKLERSDETRPPANVELAVFRVAQEALTNAIRHGRPPIAIRYDVRSDGRVTLAIDDAGEGIGADAAEEAPREGHFGLVNMQQRAEQIGALLDVRRWPSGGTRVALEWRPQ